MEDCLRRCLDSLYRQSLTNIEILLIDDASPDSCGAICEEYAQKDVRFHVFHNVTNQGLSDARNYGIAKASGDYLGFVDSDDWVEPDMFALLMDIAEETNADIVNCGFYYEYPHYTLTVSAIDKEFTDHLELIKALILGDINVHFWNKIYRKALFSNISFPKGHVYEDIRLMHQLFLKSTVVVCNSKPLYHYRRERKDAITQDNSMANLIDG